MKKRGLIVSILTISLILINLVRFVSAATYGSYTNFSFSQLLSNIDPSLIILPCVFFIFFGVIFFSLSRFMFRDNRAIAGVVSICISILMTYGLNSLTDVNTIVTGWGIDLTGMGWIIPLILILFIILVARIQTKKGRFGIGKTLIIVGLLLIGLSFTSLIYEKGALVAIAIFLMILGLILASRKKFKDKRNWGKGTLAPKFQRTSGRGSNGGSGKTQKTKSYDGTLAVTVSPNDSIVMIHGVGTFRGSSAKVLPEGKYIITVKRDGYHRQSKKIKVKRGKTSVIRFHLVPYNGGDSGGQTTSAIPPGGSAPGVQENMGHLKKRLQKMQKEQEQQLRRQQEETMRANNYTYSSNPTYYANVNTKQVAKQAAKEEDKLKENNKRMIEHYLMKTWEHKDKDMFERIMETGDPEQIKNEYNRLLLTYHPDVNNGDAIATKITREIFSMYKKEAPKRIEQQKRLLLEDQRQQQENSKKEQARAQRKEIRRQQQELKARQRQNQRNMLGKGANPKRGFYRRG